MAETLGSIVTLATKVLGHIFAAPSWSTWLVLLKAAFALPLTAEELATFQRLTGRTRPPSRPVRELWLICGRRAGKSMIAALIAVYATTCRTYRLATGEVGVFMIVAADRLQARILKRYISGFLQAAAVLRPLIARETQTAIVLTNGLVIEIHTASWRTTRGYTLVGFVGEEPAFWSTDVDAANPDAEILNAVRPAMATQPEALLVCISSPNARKGETWKAFHAHYGQDDDDVLVVNAATRDLNATVAQGVIDRAYAEDPALAAAEYGGEFRRDLEDYIAREVIDAVTIPDRRELPPMAGTTYHAFCDPSGGSSDSMTLAIAHVGRSGVLVLDRVEEARAPFDPTVVTESFAALLKRYGVRRVVGDYYGGEWVTAQFRVRGITYTTCEDAKSILYEDQLAILNAGRAELLDLLVIRSQLLDLERRTARSGRSSIDHAPRKHDDVVNAVAGVLVTLDRTVSRGDVSILGVIRVGESERPSHFRDPRDQYTEGVAMRLLHEHQQAAQRRAEHEAAEARALMLAAQPQRPDPAAALKARFEQDPAGTVALFEEVNPGVELPSFMRVTREPDLRRG